MLRQAQKMEAVGQLTAGIAHDFNNLLTVVGGGIERAKRHAGDNAELLRSLDLAQEGASRAALLTKRLLAFGRQQALAPRIINAHEPIDAAIDTLQRTLGPRIRIIANLVREPWNVEVDAQELHQALLNLGLNARDAMMKGGNIVVSTRNVHTGDLIAARTDLAPAEYFEISVSDNGTGMGPETAARAFDPFFTTKPVGEGSGLGLSQVYGFARQSGGTALVESEAGSGTTVRILLPRAEPAAQVSGARATPGGAVSPQPI
jgi:signal transduction histidine kinase